MMRLLDYKSTSGLSESCLARKIGICGGNYGFKIDKNYEEI